MQLVIRDNIEASFPFIFDTSRGIQFNFSLQRLPFSRVEELPVAGVQFFLGRFVHMQRVDFLLEFLKFFKVKVVKEHRFGLRAVNERAIVVTHLAGLLALADLGPHALFLSCSEVETGRLIPAEDLLH